ncbi:phosphotransferase [Antribacter gilvus]|uniref:phosphotransferase n=1 Tax=Antribacter gilvus TaxID=2304675 RepID=UPI000F7A7A70|nr:phosphotransferase [Antribacter gilvus]
MSAHLDLLTGDRARGLLAVAATAAGGELVDWQVRQVDHRPASATTTVAYRASVLRDGAVRTTTFGASAGRPQDHGAPGVLTVPDGDARVAVWTFPDDPALPALRRAFDPAFATDLLAEAGSRGSRGGRDRPELRVRAYRPTRRAVVEVRTPSARVFLKVVPPDRLPDLHARHAMLSGAGLLVPAPLRRDDDGLLVLSALDGTGMRTALRDGGELPAPQDVLDLLGRLPDAVAGLPRRRAWSESTRHYARVIGAAMPAEAGRAADLAGGIRERLAASGRAAGTEPTHGDLYEAQVLLDPAGRITGLLDVDTAGPGHQGDDLACLVAHLDVLAHVEGFDPFRQRVLARAYAEGFASAVDPRDLAVRVAGVLLSLATGPHRVRAPGWQAATSRRLDAVAGWLARNGW